MSLVVSRALYDAFAGTLEDRVQAFMAALDAHRLTVGVPAPIEDPVVEAIAREGGVFSVEAPVGPTAPPPPGARRIAPLAFRMRLGSLRATLTVQAALDMRADPPDPALQVLMDDLAAARVIELDSAMVRDGLALLVSRDLLTEEQAEMLCADCTPGEEAE